MIEKTLYGVSWGEDNEPTVNQLLHADELSIEEIQDSFNRLKEEVQALLEDKEDEDNDEVEVEQLDSEAIQFVLAQDDSEALDAA